MLTNKATQQNSREGPSSVISVVNKTLIEGGGIFIYSFFARQISFQIDQFEFDLKRNSSDRTFYINVNINVIVTALSRVSTKGFRSKH